MDKKTSTLDPRKHTFVNNDATKFDSNCSVCDGKQRDSVHVPTPLEQELFEALHDAYTHLEYCGYGDKWERVCAMSDHMPTKLEKALESAKARGLKMPREVKNDES